MISSCDSHNQFSHAPLAIQPITALRRDCRRRGVSFLKSATMKTIRLRNRPIEVCVDDEDFERLSKVKWYFGGKGHGTIHTTSGAGTFSLPSVIMDTPGIMYDHKDNLRECSHSQNQANREKGKVESASRFKGVTKHKGKWRARVTQNGKQFYLGLFDIEEQAAEAYNKRAKEIYGEFALLNNLEQ